MSLKELRTPGSLWLLVPWAGNWQDQIALHRIQLLLVEAESPGFWSSVLVGPQTMTLPSLLPSPGHLALSIDSVPTG